MEENEEKLEVKKPENEEEVKKLVIDLSKEGYPSEKIGLILRDKYGVYVNNFGLKISKILKEEGIWKNSDMKNINDNFEKLSNHLKENKHDYPAKRKLLKKGAKLKALKK